MVASSVTDTSKFTFRYIDNLDVSGESFSRSTLEGLDWTRYSYRQNQWSFHKETFTVPLLWDEQPGIIKRYWLFEDFEPLIMAVRSAVNKHYNVTHSLVRSLLVMLPAMSQIYPHRDGGGLELVKRTHLPLASNDNCVFTVGGERVVMRVGQLWQINNGGAIHSVANNGPTSRIHLISDFVGA